jgi:hypothetical protein
MSLADEAECREDDGREEKEVDGLDEEVVSVGVVTGALNTFVSSVPAKPCS